MNEEDIKDILNQIAERKTDIMFWTENDDYYLGEWHGLLFVDELIKRKLAKEKE